MPSNPTPVETQKGPNLVESGSHRFRLNVRSDVGSIRRLSRDCDSKFNVGFRVLGLTEVVHWLSKRP